ncbi:MAG: tetratricopeptide repeat protein [Sulfuricurvum sp.]|nr:tetratricopeptide repeat protein [Sulfuricurvum sp.]
MKIEEMTHIIDKYLLSILLVLAPLTIHAYSWKISLPVQGTVSSALSPDGTQIGIAPTFGPVVIFSAQSGQILAAKTRPTERTYSLAWQADGNGFFYGDPDGVKGVDVVAFGGNGKEKKLPGGTHQVIASPSGHWLATIDYNTLEILNLRTERLEDFSIREVRCLGWQSNDVLLVIQGGWGVGVPFVVTSYDLAQHKIVSQIELPEGTVTQAWGFDKARQRLWLGTDKGDLLEIDMQAKKVVAEHALGEMGIVALALSEDGHLAAWAGERILILNIQTLKEPPRSIPAWSTNSGNGWSPLLAWSKDDLLMAGAARSGGQWLAERRGSVVATLDEEPEELEKRFRMWREKAAGGNAEAQFTLGTLYAQGRGVDEDAIQAVVWWQKAAEAGNLQAQTQLAQAYWRGYGVEADKAKSRFWWLKAADKYRAQVEARGDSVAASILAVMYAKGRGVHNDPMLAAVMLSIAQKTVKSEPSDQDESLAENLERELRPEQKERVKAVVAEWKPGKPLPQDMRGTACGVSKHVQVGFDRKTALEEFRDFQQRLRHDIDEFQYAPSPSESEDNNATIKRLRKVFSNSFATGQKGDALVFSLAEPAPRGIVSPLNVFLMKVQETACPVGFGGKFKDDGHDVELWYVDLDPADEGVLSAFKEQKLPAYGSLERNRFPALVFERDEKGHLMWYGFSKEMSTILNYWFNIQIQ